jgi:hypothetical protein
MLAAAIAAPKISFETFAMISFSASGLCYRRAGDWITLPQIPSAFLNTMQGCHLQRLKHETNHRRSSRLHRNVSLCWRMVCLYDFGGHDGYRKCGFTSLKQCVWDVRGVGGSCGPSPYSSYPKHRYKR